MRITKMSNPSPPGQINHPPQFDYPITTQEEETSVSSSSVNATILPMILPSSLLRPRLLCSRTVAAVDSSTSLGGPTISPSPAAARALAQSH